MKLPRIITKLAAVCIAALAFTSCVTKQEAENNRRDKASREATSASIQGYSKAVASGLNPQQAYDAAAKASSEAYANAMKAPLDMDEISDMAGAHATAGFVAGIASHGAHTPAAPIVTTAPPPQMMGGHCFVAGTPVQTPAGARKIEDIRVGDSVLSFNERSGKVEPARVSKVIISKRADLMVLTSSHGSVTCSQNHRFLTAESRWTMASSLSASDKVLALGTDFAGVIPMKCAARHQDVPVPVTVHNFEVEGNHDYFVGPDAILCHNTK